MLILSLLSLVIAERVKIASKRNPAYFLTILEHAKGDFVRLMKENDIHNPAELSGFDVSGDTTELNNNGVSVCVNGWKTDIITCLRNSGEKTVFNVIRTAKDVTFKTNDGNCLTMGNYDPITNGYHLKLYSCKNDDGKQKFILMNINNANDPKTPPVVFPNSVNNNSNNPTTNETNGNSTPATLPNVPNGKVTPATLPKVPNGKVTPGPLPNIARGNITPGPLTNGVNCNIFPAFSTNGVNCCATLTPLTNGVNCNTFPALPFNGFNGYATPRLLPNGFNGYATPASPTNGVKCNTTPTHLTNGVNCNTTPVTLPNNNNFQNNATGTSSNTSMPNILFVPVSLDQNYPPESKEVSQLNGNPSPIYFDTNRSTIPTSLTGVNNFGSPAQPLNECYNNLQCIISFRPLY